jgi:hypothetical protein
MSMSTALLSSVDCRVYKNLASSVLTSLYYCIVCSSNEIQRERAHVCVSPSSKKHCEYADVPKKEQSDGYMRNHVERIV